MRFVNTKNKTKKTVNNISKKVYNNSTTPTETQYLAGYQYISNVLQFFPTAEGYVNNTVVSGINQYSYVYNYTDHLGNIRLSYKKNGTTLQILEENNYYPFGLKHTYYNTTNAQPNYKYKYNGKEYQDELGLNMYDMDMRQYDPAIARWTVQDPIVHHSMSPYIAFDNNPVFWADPSEADSVYNWDTGQYVINGWVVTFQEALDYANNGGNADGSNNNESDTPPWKDNGDGTYTAQKGDNARTLSIKLGISESDALSILKEQGYKVSSVGVLNLKVGDVININNDNLIFHSLSLLDDYTEYWRGPFSIGIASRLNSLKPVGYLGSSPGSSILSYTLGKTFTGNIFKTFGKNEITSILVDLTKTTTTGRVAGRIATRASRWIGLGLLMYDMEKFAYDIGTGNFMHWENISLETKLKILRFSFNINEE